MPIRKIRYNTDIMSVLFFFTDNIGKSVFCKIFCLIFVESKNKKEDYD